uniref:Uncharacterized protein n=1 Tax=Meloidogyne floridensis TaxID=298350 RepID=A0A915NA82_9BILA
MKINTTLKTNLNSLTSSSSTSLGNLFVSNDGLSATLTQDGVSGSVLLLITFLKIFSSKQGKITKEGDNILRVNYDYNFGDKQIQLTIHWDSKSHQKLDFYNFYWKKPKGLYSLKDSINLGSDNSVHWYGGMNTHEQSWPIKKNDYKSTEFVTNDVYQLYTSLQNNELDLQSKLDDDSSFLLRNNFLEYTLAVPKEWEKISLKDFHQECFELFLAAPTAHPSLEIINKPIWSTWANFWKAVDQNGLLEYAKQISDNNMPISQLELDDMWTVSYGDYQIDKRKFSNFSEMLKKLENEFGIKRLSAWVHPFVDADSEIGKNPELRNKLFVKNRDGDVPLVWWWDCPIKPGDPSKPVGPTNPDKKEPCAYVLDVTNPETREWWYKQLEAMKAEGICTFKFDAGETNWLPHNYVLYDGAYPNSYGKHYAHFASRFGSAVENRYGSGTQQTNFFTRTIDRNSYWDKDGGLSTLIPWALQSSLHGYYWNLPDMIGGNGLNHNESNIRGEPPEEELYIRWTQANTLLLAMQFSYPPWHSKYGGEVLNIVKKSLELRKKWMHYLIKNVRKSVEDKVPVIRPMWWASDDNEALTIDDQFMVGSDLVVAPVIKSGQKTRNVYLPEGNWRNGNNVSEVVIGPTTIKDYPESKSKKEFEN